MTESQQIIEFVRKTTPEAVRLAKVVSLAVRVEPALLRRARLELLPDAGAGAEAELWFSPLVESQSLLGLVMRQEVAEELRLELFKEDRQLFDRAWRLLDEFRQNDHPTIRLEERLTRFSLADEGDNSADAEIEGLLTQVLAAMATNKDPEGIARWALRALPRLPERVRNKPAAAMLAIGAGARMGGRQVLEGELPPDAFEKYLPWLLPENIPRVSVGVRRTQNGVEFGEPSIENAHEIRLPKTDPLVIELLWGVGDHRQSRRLSITQGAQGIRLPIALPADQIELRTALGESYLLSLEEGEGDLRRPLEIPNFSELRARHRPFFDREDLMNRLERLIWEGGVERAGYIVLIGGPGLGKTASLCHFLDLQEERRRAVPHLFNLRDFTPDAASHALAAQIERLYPRFADARLQSPSADQKLRIRVLLEAVSHGELQPKREKLALLLDGVDEMDQFDRLLDYFPTFLPSNIIVLLSTRRTELYGKWVETERARNQLIEIDLDAPEWRDSNEKSRRAFWEYHAPRFTPPLRPDLTEFLIRQSDGDMLYAKLAHEWLSAQSPDSRRLERLPQYLRATQAEREKPPYIRWLQGALNQTMRLGLYLDGILGGQTRDYLVRFQRRQGLVAHGNFDLPTEAALIGLGVEPIRNIEDSPVRDNYSAVFQYDIFISYAHADNERLGADDGWVDLLHQRLETRLRQLLGESVKTWSDRKLSGGDIFDQTIQDALSRSALFICVVSPRYVRSEWCRRELSEFIRRSADTGGVTVDGMSRIIKVVKTPIARDEQLRELDDLLGYEFYANDPVRSRFTEFDSDLGSQRDKRYWERLDDLAQDISRLLSTLKSRDIHSTPEVPNPSRAAVYLAETVFDLKSDRDRIKRELQSRGYKVLPEGDLPLEGDAFRNSAHNALRESALSIHLVGSQYGIVPEGEDKSVVELQYEMARERASEPGFSQLVWAASNLQPQDPRQRQFLERIQSGASSSSEIFQTNLEDFLTSLQKKLSSTPIRGAGPAR